MSKRMFVRILFVMFLVSVSLLIGDTRSFSSPPAPDGETPQKADVDKAKQEMTEAEKLAEKLLFFKGEKVTLLGTSLPGCPPDSSDRTVLFYRYDDKERKARFSPDKYAGQTGVILEAKLVERATPEIVIQIDNTGEKIVAKDDQGLGFHSELETAKGWVGRSLWTKGKYIKIVPAIDPCSHPAEAEQLQLQKFQRVTVTRVEFGHYKEPIFVYAKTDNGREGRIDLLSGSPYFDEKFHVAKYSRAVPFSDDFFSADPRKTYPAWTEAIWKLIEKDEVAIGMNEEMVKMACVGSMVRGKLKEDGFVLSATSNEIATIYSCSGKRFLMERGKVTRYVFDR
jgi:hypothetical protein